MKANNATVLDEVMEEGEINLGLDELPIEEEGEYEEDFPALDIGKLYIRKVVTDHIDNSKTKRRVAWKRKYCFKELHPDNEVWDYTMISGNQNTEPT